MPVPFKAHPLLNRHVSRVGVSLPHRVNRRLLEPSPPSQRRTVSTRTVLVAQLTRRSLTQQPKGRTPLFELFSGRFRYLALAAALSC
jgi:hypothetical protein